MAEIEDTRAPSASDLKAIIETERSGIPFVHWRDGAGAQQILTLTPAEGRLTIGRRERSDIPLTWDAEVSREHALLEPVGEQWTLVDDGLSRNGSFVNGGRVHGRRRLHNGDVMTFGNTRVTFRDPVGAAGSQSTARAPDAPASVPLTETQRKVLVVLGRPLVNSSSSTPATNPQIAAELHMSVDAVKAHLRQLFDRFGLGELPQNEKRTRLVSIVLESGLLRPHDF